MKRAMLTILLLFPFGAAAQDATPTPEPEAVEYAFEFPLPAPTEAQIDEAYECVLNAEFEEGDAPESEPTDACRLANDALALAETRESDGPSAEELELFYALVGANPALALRITLIATFFNVPALVAAPSFADQPVTAARLTYTFFGLGPSNAYDIVIDASGEEPLVSGTAEIRTTRDAAEPIELPETVEAEAVEALGGALTGLLPIAEQFSAAPCWDYYPDWTLDLTFADGTTVTMVTNQSNVIGIGGPWQTEIDGQNYMQYSGALNVAVGGLLEALDLPLGETAAMGCGGANEPLFDAYPRGAETEAQ